MLMLIPRAFDLVRSTDVAEVANWGEKEEDLHGHLDQRGTGVRMDHGLLSTSQSVMSTR